MVKDKVAMKIVQYRFVGKVGFMTGSIRNNRCNECRHIGRIGIVGMNIY